MKTNHNPVQLRVFGLLLLLGALPSQAAEVNVSVIDFAFSPSSVSINVNDSVKWTWSGNFHSSTSTSSLWDSGVHNAGFVFTRTFSNAGNFPYVCSIHGFMTGSVNVQAPNSPPSVSLTSPSSGSVFGEPAGFTLAATASDPDGSVASVQFFQGATSLGTDTTSPYSWPVNNLAAANYTFSAVASDNNGLKATNQISVSVVTPVDIVLGDGQRLSATQFRFTYTANPGLRYAVEKAMELPGFIAISTNPASAGTVTFTDNAATNRHELYRVRRLPNP